VGKVKWGRCRVKGAGGVTGDGDCFGSGVVSNPLFGSGEGATQVRKRGSWLIIALA